MQKSFVTLLLFLTTQLWVNAMEGVDFSRTTIEFTKVTKEGLDKCNALSKEIKTKGKVVLRKNVTQKGFDQVCNKLTWIKELYVRDNKEIDNIKAISKLKKLRVLNLKSLKKSSTFPLDLSPLKKCKHITHLDLSYTKISDSKPLVKLKLVKELKFTHSNLPDLSFLKGKKQLETLSLHGTQHTFSNYKALSGLTTLKKLDIRFNPQATDENLAALSTLTQLQKIQLKQSKNVTHLNFLKNCKSLKVISAPYLYKMKDISVVKELSQLTDLDVQYSSITSLRGLEKCTKLELIKADHTKISDITALRSLSRLIVVKVGHTDVSDISPILYHTRLKSVRIDDDVSEDQIWELKKNNKKVRLRTIKGKKM